MLPTSSSSSSAMAAAIVTSRVEKRLTELISIPSLTGLENEAILYFRKQFEDMKAEVDYWRESMKVLQQHPSFPGREVEREDIPVVCGRLVGKYPGPKVLLAGHVDVAPPGDPNTWPNKAPFTPQIIGDRCYGIGSCDMKAGLISALEAFETIANTDRDFHGELYFVVVSGGQDGGSGTLAAIRRGYYADFAIIPSATASSSENADLGIMHAGYLTVSLTLQGKRATAAKRLEGEDPLSHFQSIYAALRREEKELNEKEMHPLMRELKLPYPTSIGRIQGGNWSSDVIESLHVDVRLGVTLGESLQQARERFQKTIRELGTENMWLEEHPPKIDDRKGPSSSSSSIASDHALVRILQESAFKVRGKRSKLSAVSYGSEMALWSHLAKTPTVLYGPGDPRLAHTPNEFVSVQQTINVSEVLVETLRKLLKMPSPYDHITISPSLMAQQEEEQEKKEKEKEKEKKEKEKAKMQEAELRQKEKETEKEKEKGKDGEKEGEKEEKEEKKETTTQPQQVERGWLRQFFYDLKKI